ncbi:MFS transporter [Sporomusa acidovorans]|uniref:Niacin/nicotinamide transporter NaiP n=1 Tax=Sporomusa acidovorans (strain ATCC 49682 / DSM 3132 / Mol) TaxID=1123286 RepID=A0ABZ3J266_SPOA4|nr:MFS transporter [Sporomusa acidovorans]OZC19970.1 putative niacin/nicotinamide transporter NaiP [Sporomusa acidovorans DSM 3132]SDD48802.1 MFS transporter, putative metabolite:H+ symporter [Sporomusa acidovorans]
MASVTQRLENLPLGKWHWRLLGIIAVGWAFDAMDTGIVSFVLPKLMAIWQLSSAQIGFIGSMGLVGMAVGAALAGTLADYMGRKKVLAATLLIYGLGTGACGFAWSYESLLVFRFIVGFGLGGQVPVAVTLMSEYSPTKYRGRMIVLLESSWAFGWLAAAIISYLVIPKYGWQLAFYVGAFPVIWVFYLWWHVPESAHYLIKKGQLQQAHELVCSVERSLGVPCGEPPQESDVAAPAKSVFSLAKLFTGPYLKKTICLWILWFGVVFSYYGIFMWLPTLLVKAGHSMVQSFEFVLWMTLAQIPGYFTAAALVDKIGRKPTISAFLILCAGTAYMFGTAATWNEILIWGCLMSFFNLGAWGLMYTYTPELYPTEARASGTGWAGAFGRIGGMLAPLVVGAMFTGPDKFSLVFAMFAGVLIFIALNVLVLGEETMNKSLEATDQSKSC